MALDTAPIQLPDMDETRRGTPAWWLDRLGVRLAGRRDRLDKLDAYYRGDHDLQYATKKFKAAFGALFSGYAENICKLIVDAAKERMHVIGFRMGADRDLEADDDAWRIWQANQMDAWHTVGHRLSLVEEQSYVGVWTNPDDVRNPRMSVLEPRTTIVAIDPENPRRRLAALRMWQDEWTGRLFATVYLPNATWKFQSTAGNERDMRGNIPDRQQPFSKRWEPRILPDEPWPLPNPLRKVPIVALTNEPQLDGTGISEINPIVPINDAINFAVANMMLGIEFAVFRQKWIANFVLAEEPVLDKDGNPVLGTDGTPKMRPVEPFRLDMDRMLVAPPPSPGDPEPRFGEFSQTDLSPYIKFVEQRLQMAATITRTPHHYILGGQGTYPSGETLNATEVGLVAKVRDKILFAGETWEESIRLAFAVLGDPRGQIMDSEVIWRDPERRTESQHVDAVLKMQSMGIPDEMLWEELGFTPQRIARIRQLNAQAALLRPIPELGVPRQNVTATMPAAPGQTNGTVNG